MLCGSKVRIFFFLRAVVNIPMQTLIISPRLLFRKMIIAQLELGPPVELVNGNGGGGVVGTAEGRSGETIVSSLLMYKVKAGDAV